jgi:predicted molibdopterin-dependent oxidoreductase YjgC
MAHCDSHWLRNFFKAQPPAAMALIASARMTNEELFLARRLVAILGITRFDVVSRMGEPDGLPYLRRPQSDTNGARLLGLTGDAPGHEAEEDRGRR